MSDVTMKEVVTNLKNYDGWDYQNYSMRKEEAEAIIAYYGGRHIAAYSTERSGADTNNQA